MKKNLIFCSNFSSEQHLVEGLGSVTGPDCELEDVAGSVQGPHPREDWCS